VNGIPQTHSVTSVQLFTKHGTPQRRYSTVDKTPLHIRPECLGVGENVEAHSPVTVAEEGRGAWRKL
jgi:hypothetical protein